MVQVTTGLTDQQFECDSNSSSGAGSGQEKEEAGRVWQMEPGQQAAQYQARPSNGHQEQVLYTPLYTFTLAWTVQVHIEWSDNQEENHYQNFATLVQQRAKKLNRCGVVTSKL